MVNKLIAGIFGNVCYYTNPPAVIRRSRNLSPRPYVIQVQVQALPLFLLGSIYNTYCTLVESSNYNRHCIIHVAFLNLVFIPCSRKRSMELLDSVDVHQILVFRIIVWKIDPNRKDGRFSIAKNTSEFNSPLKQSRIQREGHMVCKRTPSTDGVGNIMLQFQCSCKEEQKRKKHRSKHCISWM
jgi:hypothetical protein